MSLLLMFFTFIKIGLFSFGGGYAILAMIQQETVFNHPWLTQSEFTDIVAISQTTPGPIAINAATFIGYKQAGIWGSIVCTLGVILPSLIIMLVITLTYLKLKKQPWFQDIFKRLRLITLGLIAAAMVLIAGSAFVDMISVGIFIAALGISWFLKPNPLYVMLGAALLGILIG